MLEINLIKIPSLVIKIGGDRKIVANGKQGKGSMNSLSTKDFKLLKK